MNTNAVAFSVPRPACQRSWRASQAPELRASESEIQASAGLPCIPEDGLRKNHLPISLLVGQIWFPMGPGLRTLIPG